MPKYAIAYIYDNTLPRYDQRKQEGNVVSLYYKGTKVEETYLLPGQTRVPMLELGLEIVEDDSPEEAMEKIREGINRHIIKMTYRELDADTD